MLPFHYQCTECGKSFDINPHTMVCDICSINQSSVEPLRGVLEVKIEKELSSNQNYHHFLPVPEEFFPTMRAGNTPCWQISSPETHTDHRLFVKAEMLNPTGSIKDRASYLVVAMAKQYQISTISLAATGNMASAMAGFAAASGIKLKLFIPAEMPITRLTQILQYGAELVEIEGNKEKAFAASMAYIKKTSSYSGNIAYNPLTIEGIKATSLELYQQFNGAPDFIFVPVGDGVVITGIIKGFQDLKDQGLIQKVPTFIGVQSSGSQAMYQAWKTGSFSLIHQADTVSKSISVDIPKNGFYTLKMMEKHHGEFMVVEDDSILKAQHSLSKAAGIFAEPAAASVYAGYQAYKDKLPKSATIVLMITGNGLNDLGAANQQVSISKKT